MAKKKSNKEPLQSFIKNISFNAVDIKSTTPSISLLKIWVIFTILNEKKTPGEISFNFCSDKYLLEVNKQYLNHNYFTDIITFDLCENKIIAGDIYISRDRVKDNAKTLSTMFHVELYRVIIHGVLHLCGYKDKTPKDQTIMRKKENYYLSLLVDKSLLIK